MAILRLIIADDDDKVRWLLSRLLSSEFMIVGVASNGEELVRLAELTAPDVIVSDVSMPVLSGLKVISTLKSKGMDIPCVLISADSTAVQECIQGGATAFVSKVDLAVDLIPAITAAKDRHLYVSRCARLQYDSTVWAMRKLLTNPNE